MSLIESFVILLQFGNLEHTLEFKFWEIFSISVAANEDIPWKQLFYHKILVEFYTSFYFYVANLMVNRISNKRKDKCNLKFGKTSLRIGRIFVGSFVYFNKKRKKQHLNIRLSLKLFTRNFCYSLENMSMAK